MDWENIIKAESNDELKEAKLWLFQEQMRLDRERREIDEAREKFLKERTSFMTEMNELNRRSTLERQRLKQENIFFDKKMEILQDGFRKLEEDRRLFEREKILLEHEREEYRSRLDETSYYGDSSIAGILFRNATNPLTLRKRYKDLMKIFHPDNLAGDAELVQMINREFAIRKREDA